MQVSRADAQQKVNEYFESSSAYWKKIYSDDTLLPTIYQCRHRTALQWITNLGLSGRARILDAGCGAGLMTMALAKNGYVVDAMDATMSMLEIASKDAIEQGIQNQIRLHFGDVHALPFDAEVFDLVVAIGVIPWLHSECVALQEMHRVLKPGGYLLVTADNEGRLNRIVDPLSSPLVAPLRTAAKQVLQLCGSWSPASGFQPKRHYPREVDRLVAGCGFTKVQSCTIGFGPFTFFGSDLFSDAAGVRLHRMIQGLVAGKAGMALRWTGSHYLLLAIKA